MGRRIRWLGLIMIVCLAAVIVQLVNIQLVRPSAQGVGQQPAQRVEGLRQPAGQHLCLRRNAAGAVRSSASASPFLYLRKYPQGSLYSQVVGYASRTTGRPGSRTSTTSS